MRKLTLGKIYKNGIQYSGTTDAATNINYDNSKGAIKAGNVQGAIDEIMETTSQSRNLTQAEYDALPDTKYTDGIEYFITDAEPLDASTIAYDNTTSKMTATNVQAGIDELNSNLTQVQSQIVPTASIEIGATASKAYNVGDFIVKDGILYKVTKAISKDDALTVGTNIELDTVASELSSISERLSKMPQSEYKVKEYTLEYTRTRTWVDYAIEEQNAIIDANSYFISDDTCAPINYGERSLCYINYKDGANTIKMYSNYACTAHVFIRYK